MNKKISLNITKEFMAADAKTVIDTLLNATNCNIERIKIKALVLTSEEYLAVLIKLMAILFSTNPERIYKNHAEGEVSLKGYYTKSDIIEFLIDKNDLNTVTILVYSAEQSSAKIKSLPIYNIGVKSFSYDEVVDMIPDENVKCFYYFLGEY